MAEVLSQTEIDALLAAVSTGGVETEAPPKQGGNDWIAYDLTSQEKIIRSRLIGLEGIHERFARLLRITLTNTLKKNVSVNCVNTDFMRLADYMGNILLPTSLSILSVPNLQGHMIFVVSSKLAYALVDAYYGGSERPFSKIGGREQFTMIETSMIKKICLLAMTDLKEAWKMNYPLDLEFLRTESNPHFVGAIHGTDLVAVVTFEVEFENMSGPFILILQLRSLDPIQEYLSVNVTSEGVGQEQVWKDHWLHEIMGLELVVRAELGVAPSSVGKVHQWKIGDKIPLQQDSSSGMRVFVEDIPKFLGLMGACRGNQAVRVIDRITTEFP